MRFLFSFMVTFGMGMLTFFVAIALGAPGPAAVLADCFVALVVGCACLVVSSRW